MSFSTALYDGDRVLHTPPRTALAAKSRAVDFNRSAATRDVMDIAGRAEAERQGWGDLMALVSNALRSFFLWIDAKSREAHYRRVEAYLARSCDHADLERRQREMEFRNHLNWTDCGSR